MSLDTPHLKSLELDDTFKPYKFYFIFQNKFIIIIIITYNFF
jgi:hypothetical protein